MTTECTCKKDSCPFGCTIGHTHKGFSCKQCNPMTTATIEERAREVFDHDGSCNLLHAPSEIAYCDCYRSKIPDFVRSEISLALQQREEELREALRERQRVLGEPKTHDDRTVGVYIGLSEALSLLKPKE